MELVNITAAGIDFETLLPLIGAVFTFTFGIFIWFMSPRTNVNIIFLAFCVAITYWLFGTFEMFLNRSDVESAISWDRFVYIGVVFVPSLMHHFSLAITGNKGQRKLLAVGYAFSFFFLIASRTDWFVDGLNVFPRLVHTKAMMGHHIFLVQFFFFAPLMFYNLFRFYCSTRDRRKRRMVLFTAGAFASILLIGGTAYLPAYGVDIGYPFSYFSGVIFVFLLGIAVTQYQFLSSRTLIVEMFVLLASLVLASDIVLARGIGELSYGVIALIIFLYFGFAMIRSIRAEIEQRVKIQKLAQRLTDANAQLKVLDEAKSEFISIASHQLRTPASVLKGYLAMMLDGDFGEVPAALKDKLQLMYSMNERLIHLINNILSMSRIEKNSLEFVCSYVDVASAIEEVVYELTAKAKEKKLELRFDKPAADLAKAYVDSEKLHEIVANLIENALKYTIKGTVQAKVEIRRGLGGDEVVFKVTDSGIGMSEEDTKRLFEKFYRAKSTIGVPRETGTGLGLYICAKFLDNMGGRIWIEKTSPGQGTTFAVALPTKPQQRCASAK